MFIRKSGANVTSLGTDNFGIVPGVETGNSLQMPRWLKIV